MKDLEELGRLKDLGLLTDEEFETARQEIFSQRPTANDPADDGDAEPEEPERPVEEGEVASPSELDIVSVDDETTTDGTDNWWQASDGQWYPPEALDALKEQGWFQGDDGQWYPPPQPVIEEPSPTPPDQTTEASSEQAPASAEPAAEASAITHDRTEGTPETDEPDALSRVRRVSTDPLIPVPPADRSTETSVAGRQSFQNATSASRFSNRRLAVGGGLFVAAVAIVMVFALSNQNVTESREYRDLNEERADLLASIDGLERALESKTEFVNTASAEHGVLLQDLNYEISELEEKIQSAEIDLRGATNALEQVRPGS